MRGVILDEATLAGSDLDLGRLLEPIENWQRYPSTSPEQVAERIAGAAVLLSNKVYIGRELMQANPQLKYIGVLATGTNNVDLIAAKELNICVSNIVGYGTPSVAQHTFALLLNLATKANRYNSDIAAGRWQQSVNFCFLDHPIVELSGKTMVIVGYGVLGKAVAKLAEAFGMTVVIARTPGSPNADSSRPSLLEALPQADVLSLHCPLTDDTKAMLDAETLALLPKHALLLNTARGGLVDEQALADALRAGSLGGAGFDVLSAEPPKSGNPLLADDIPNLILTPHSAWGAQESRQRLVNIAADNLCAYLAGESLNRVA